MIYSIFWARLLGLYTFIMSIGLFFHLKKYQALMTEMSQNMMIMMIFGMVTLFLGLTIVLSHRTIRGWPIIITVIGYLIVIKGILLMFFPQWVQKVISIWQAYDNPIAIIPPLVISIILLICGFVVKRHPI